MDRLDLASLNGMRFHLYGILRHVFSEYPSAESLDAVFSDLTRESLATFSKGADGELVQVIEDFNALEPQLSPNDLQSLTTAFTKLFIGPGTPAAPLWESVYLSPKGLLFQQSTLDVRNAYAEEGFRFVGYPAEPDDCLGAELDFVKHLAQRTSDALENEDYARCGQLIDSQISFLEHHLLLWVKEFSNNVQNAEVSQYYEVLSALLVSYLFFDACLLAEIKDTLSEIS